MRGVALVLLALLIRALTSCHESSHEGILVDKILLVEESVGFCINEYRERNWWCSGSEHGEMFCVEVQKVKLLLLYHVFSESQCLCICIFASQNCQALSCYLTSDHVKAVCLHMSLHLSVCVSFFCVCPIFIRPLGNQHVKLTAWLIRRTALSSSGIFFLGQRCINITIQLYCMTEHCLLAGAVCGFTASGMSCLAYEFLLSLNLSHRTENSQRKNVSWKMMFYKMLSTSVCVCAALLYGCTSVPKCTSVVHGDIKSVTNKTKKYSAHTHTLHPDFLKYKEVLCKINILSKKIGGSQSAERYIKKLHAYKNTRCQKGDISRLLKYNRCTTIKGIGHVRMIGSVSLSLFCNTAANIISNYQQRCPTNPRVHHSKLSFVLLLTVSSCSFVSLHVRSGCSCKVHHTVFGISFVLSISCVLGKRILVFMAFRATFSGNMQRLKVFAFIICQVCMCVLCLIGKQPSFNCKMNRQRRIVLGRS